MSTSLGNMVQGNVTLGEVQALSHTMSDLLLLLDWFDVDDSMRGRFSSGCSGLQVQLACCINALSSFFLVYS